MTPAQRKLRAKIAAHSKHAQGKTDTSAARAAFLAKFENDDELRVHMMKMRLARLDKAAAPKETAPRKGRAFSHERRVDAFWAKVDKNGPGGCWLWTGAKSAGYGHFWDGSRGRMVLAHRFAFETFVGPIPDDKEIDHVAANGCRHRHCVNYEKHLEPVTYLENQLRSPLTFAGKAAA